MNGEFQLSPAARESMVAHARAARPAECCGVLIGTDRRIDIAVAGRNIAGAGDGRDPTTRYLLDPRDHISARREARQRGLTVVGFYHSHPASPAWPSPTDIAEATYPDALHAIVSLSGEQAEVRLFQIEGERVVELPFETETPTA